MKTMIFVESLPAGQAGTSRIPKTIEKG